MFRTTNLEDKERDFHSDSSAEYFASSGYQRLKQKKISNSAKQQSFDGTEIKMNADQENNLDIDNESSASDEDLAHQAPLITSYFDDDDATSHGSQSDADRKNFTETNPKSCAWLTDYKVSARKQSESMTNPFEPENYRNTVGVPEEHHFGDEVFRNAPFPRIDWDAIHQKVEDLSLKPTADRPLVPAQISNDVKDTNVFANAPWTYRVVPQGDLFAVDFEGEAIFDNAPLGSLSYIIPLSSNF